MPIALSSLAGALLLIIGIPVGLVLIAIPMVYMFADPALTMPMLVIPQKMFGAMDSFPLMAVPFFVLVGQVMNTGGITNRIFDFANALVGHMRGGLAQVNIIASLLMSGMSGSAVADASGLGQVEIEAMRKQGYDPAFAAAVTASSATIGPIVPPSIPLVIVGAITNTSISQLLVAGLLPGILMTVAMCLLVAYIGRRDNLPTSERASFRHLLATFGRSAPALFAPVLLVGGILLGVFTPTEASAVAAVYAIIIAMFWYRELSLKALYHVLFQSAITVGAIFFVIAGAAALSWLLTWLGVPQALAQSLSSLAETPTLLMLAIIGFLLIVGCFLESNAALILVAPLLVPIGIAAGFDPVHLGTVMVLVLMLGLITPPVGMNMFIVMAIAKVSLGQYLRATWPFFIVLLVSTLIVAFVPWISLVVPQALLR
ncbi:TRAP transporter large permease [Acuticoccus kandeliae]|uniref:TRAP transporter large permease n=1 Tax=Acuticoccus kandeliae TaxID=2073160 RepID=UPI000D3EC6A9|nr:TRAP transporter large permease [Acuticoccus kandeliae]